jgi:hypothetical protein
MAGIPVPPIDHLVLPVASLATARARLSALGFTVAPEGVHPFGTVNACVYLADGTFLEPLAIGDENKAVAAIRAGNVFVARDAAFREACAEEGLSALVLGADDADANDATYRAEGISAGGMLEFSRAFVGADGKSDTASFRLAFAAMRDAPDAFFFACQRVNVPHVDRSALQAHPNTVVRLKAVPVAASDPERARTFLQRDLGIAGAPTADPAASNAAIPVRTARELRDEFGIDAPADSALRLAAVVFGVADLAAAEANLTRSAIAFRRHAGRLVIAPAAGQGVPFLFEAA